MNEWKYEWNDQWTDKWIAAREGWIWTEWIKKIKKGMANSRIRDELGNKRTNYEITS